jgi:type IV secretory pathway ATPase VirB11/archaellum biosynthesis ATPase
MNLELNLVKTRSIDSKIGKLIQRHRVEVENSSDVMVAICKFIRDNNATFTAALTDQVFVEKLANINSLTISEFNCLRYVLAEKGLDIWVWSTKVDEVNPNEVPSSVFEYSIIDTSFIQGGFIPFATRFIQTNSDNSLPTVYTQILDAYGLFQSQLFSSMKNPLKNMIEAMKVDQDAVGMVSSTKTTYVNSMLEFIGKDIRVITD